MKLLTSLFVLLSVTSANAAEVYSQTHSCKNGEIISLSLDVVKNLPAQSVAKEYCSQDETGESCDTAYFVSDALTATWTVRSNLSGLGSFKKSFPISILIFPVHGSNPITLVNELGFSVPKIRISEDRHLSFNVGANFSYKANAAMTSTGLVTDLLDLDEIFLNAGVFDYRNDGDVSVLCNF